MRNAKEACEWFLKSQSMEHTVSILGEKVASPLAATVATILLIRARKYLKQRSDYFENIPYLKKGAEQWAWVANLAKLFPYLSDTAVLWNEILWDGTYAHISPVEIPSTVERNFRRLDSRILPYTVEAQGYLASQLADAQTDSGFMPPFSLVERVRLARRYLMPGGLFATFSGPNQKISPNLVLPIRKA